MNKSLWFVIVVLVVLTTAAVLATSTPQLEFDHVWIMVSPNAPERAALERAGFQISPNVNRHEGQGTASITVEFQNAFLELMWPDSTVPVRPELERAAEKFRQRTSWRTSGWCPIGIGFRRAAQTNDPLPFPTWSTSAPWLPPGSAIEMLTPREDTRSPSLFISPRSLTNMDEQAARAALFHHAIGAHRVTAIRLVSPKTYLTIEPLSFLRRLKVIEVEQGEEWVVELTFDGGQSKKTQDLRPDLPLIIRY